MCKEKTLHTFTAKPVDKEFVTLHNEYERYALVYSKSFAKIYDNNKSLKELSNNNSALEGFVKIKYNGETVYRKCCAHFGINGGEIAIGYRTMCKLGITEEDKEVEVVSTNWFCYLWKHVDSIIRCPFRIAVISLLISVIGIITTLSMIFI